MANISSITAYMNTMNNVKGMTLIELMVTLSIIAILVAIGLPGMQGTSQNNRLTATINSLSGDLAFAKSEAANRNVPVIVSSASGTVDWSGGWVISTVPIVSAPVPVNLRNSPALAANILLSSASGTVSLIYVGDGSATNGDGSAIVGGPLTFKTCKSGDITAHGREIQIVATGRIKLLTKRTCP